MSYMAIPPGQAAMLLRNRVPRRPHPLGYVPGGAPLNVARAIQARNRGLQPPPSRRRIIPPRPGAPGVGTPGVDPLWTRANNTVMQFMNPMLSRLAAQRVAAEANARQVAAGHGQALGAALTASAKPMDESFNRGIVSSAAVNDALAARLGTQGATAQGDLSTKLAQIGAQDTGQIAQTYKGAADAGFATGSADLQRLIAERAAGGAYQAKLPGIGLLAGEKDLQQALSEMRQNFGEQEQGLTDQAAEQSFSLWDKFRGEKREDVQSRQDQLAAQAELYAKQKMALTALAATAQTKADKMGFDAQQKALDRQNKLAMAQIRAQTSMYGVDTRAATAAKPKPAKPPSLTGPANQKFITVNGKVVKNPNYNPSASSGGAPSGPQTAVTYNEIVKRIVNSDGMIRSKFALKPDLQIAQEINKGLDLRKIPRNSPEAKRIRQEIFKYLNQKQINWKVDGEYGTYHSPAWGTR